MICAKQMLFIKFINVIAIEFGTIVKNFENEKIKYL